MAAPRYAEVPLTEMADGQVQDGHRVLSARKRLGMVGVLAVVAGTAVFFNAEEQAAEMKIWDTEVAGRRNGTALADQQKRRFVLGNGLSWTAAEEKCKALGAGICRQQAVCRYEEQDKKGKDMLKTGKKGGTKDKKGKNPEMRRVKQLCAGKGTNAALPADVGKGNKKQRQKGGLKGLGSVCSENEKVELQSRWLPVLDGGQHLWANVKTCDVKPSVPDEKEHAVVACCGTGAQSGKGQGLFAAVHPPVVIQAAEEMVKQRKQGKAGKTDDDWSKHEYIDKMRNSDPFLAHKKKGTKMKAVHDHVAEKATEQLGNATVAALSDGLKNVHGKIKQHIDSVVDAIKSRSNSTKLGAVSGALLTGDVSKARNMVPVSQIVKNATKTLTAMQARVPGSMFSTRASAYGKMPATMGARSVQGPTGAGRSGSDRGSKGAAASAGRGGDGSRRPDGAVETRRGRSMMPAPGN